MAVRRVHAEVQIPRCHGRDSRARAGGRNLSSLNKVELKSPKKATESLSAQLLWGTGLFLGHLGHSIIFIGLGHCIIFKTLRDTELFLVPSGSSGCTSISGKIPPLQHPCSSWCSQLCLPLPHAHSSLIFPLSRAFLPSLVLIKIPPWGLG